MTREKLRTWPRRPRPRVADVIAGLRETVGVRVAKSTPLICMGSCFAASLRVAMIHREYNVLDATGHPPRCCTIFNAATFEQEMRRAVGTFGPADHWCIENEVEDPYRYKVTATDVGALEADRLTYRVRWERALQEAGVFVLTLGQSEVWHSNSGYLPTYPRAERDQYQAGTLGYEYTRELLQSAWQLLGAYGQPRLVLTVSPVPLKRTWRDVSPVIANADSKATLRAAVGDFAAETTGVSYFPAYEIATQCFSEPYQVDGRHVRREVIAAVIAAFDEVYGE